MPLLGPGYSLREFRDDKMGRAAMISAEIAGALVLAVPALVAAWIALRRHGAGVFLFAAALIVVGVGYLTMTGATADIARALVPGLVSAR